MDAMRSPNCRQDRQSHCDRCGNENNPVGAQQKIIDVDPDIGQSESMPRGMKIEIVRMVTSALRKISKEIAASDVGNNQPGDGWKKKNPKNDGRNAPLPHELKQREEKHERPGFNSNALGEGGENR